MRIIGEISLDGQSYIPMKEKGNFFDELEGGEKLGENNKYQDLFVYSNALIPDASLICIENINDVRYFGKLKEFKVHKCEFIGNKYGRHSDVGNEYELKISPPIILNDGIKPCRIEHHNCVYTGAGHTFHSDGSDVPLHLFAPPSGSKIFLIREGEKK